MIKNISNLIFMTTLMIGSLISISSNSWLGAWMGLEINLLSFIPIIINLKNSLSTESALKYFLTQALASSILLFSILIISIKNNYLHTEINSLMNFILNSTLFMKMGAAPFHFWFPEMMEGLSWMTSLILMTWQKIAPMILISYCLIPFYAMTASIISIIAGSIGGLNQLNLRKLMAYSSINHLGWMLGSLMISNFYWLVYFSLYTLISTAIISLFNQFNLFKINQLFNLSNFNPLMKFLLFCNLLSLGGLPPFTGFLPKWIVIQMMSSINPFLISMMVVPTLITLFFYIRLSYSAFLINYTQTKWNFYYESKMNKSIILHGLTLLGLPIISIIYFTL
uniref:NADH dehydrogenase subunit 2 n=1 Tax=Micromus paganus TaxID=1504851 RepID=UPI001BEDB222|nr:NADH dehydrogenase subunit 2 [Micromus paganus]QTZ19027.1 NADH dehydrogenase subunit 2 [Micromus paganus]